MQTLEPSRVRFHAGGWIPCESLRECESRESRASAKPSSRPIRGRELLGAMRGARADFSLFQPLSVYRSKDMLTRKLKPASATRFNGDMNFHGGGLSR